MSKTRERSDTANLKPLGGSGLVVVAQPTSPVAEAYRSLRATVKFAGIQPPVRVLLIADSGTRGQASSTAANLAAALALGGDRVVLVDTNLRNPQIHRFFGLRNEQGLVDWLTSDDVNQPFVPIAATGIPNLTILPAGTAPSTGVSVTPADLLTDDSWARLLDRLRDEADFIVLDAAPIPEYGDALAIAARADAVLIVVRSGKTKRTSAQRAKDLLERVGARILGVVLTDSGQSNS